jgi:tricorn protease
VEEASDGRFGYLHLIDMGGAGLSQFAHQYYGQADRDGLVIDVRDNGGGFVSQLILDQLAQEITGYDQPRHGTTSRYPAHAFPGHLVVIINQHAGSDGDIFPYMFREMELGPLVGTRTWGGVVGIRADKESVDDGMTTQPEYATWTVADGWGMENYGVDPDIEVDITPSDRMAGRDTQLERAVQELERMLQAEPVVRPSPPPYPGAE